MRAWLILIVIGCSGGQKTKPAEDNECEPGRCLDDLARAVAERRDAARACYDAKPNLPDARVTVNFEIDAEGKVTSVSQSVKDEQLDEAEVVACILDVIKEITFPKSSKGKRTRGYHTFEFTART
jgi:hypothetical protein